jgi:SulP family sulfate permease
MKNLLEKFSEFKNYNLNTFISDLNAGLVTGIIAIPLSLALAIATGVPPIYGLYTAAIAGLTAAFFAGSKYSVTGPAAAMVPVLAGIISQNGLESLPFIGVLSGIILVIFGLTKVGYLIKYIPLSVTLGFTAGIAITLFFGQLNGFLGLTGLGNHEHFHEKLIDTFLHLTTINTAALIIGIISLLILILLPKVKFLAKVPPSLVAVTLCTLAVALLPQILPSLGLQNVSTISSKYGEIALGFPPFRIVEIKQATDLLQYIAPAFQIAILVSIESLLCALIADKMTKSRHNSNQELISQGIANIINPFFTGIPSTAVIARTGTSIKNGAKTRIAPIIHSLIVIIFLMALAPVGGKIPLTVLSSILIVTAWKISEAKEIAHLFKKAPKEDLIILFGTMILTIFLDLTVAVGFGMVLSIMFIFRRLSAVYAHECMEKNDFIDEDLYQLLNSKNTFQLVNLEGNLSSGSVSELASTIHIKEGTTRIVLRMNEVHHIDLSGLEALQNYIESLKESGLKVYFISINPRIEKRITKFNLMQKIDGVFADTDELKGLNLNL